MNQHKHPCFFRTASVICLLIVCMLLLNACGSGKPDAGHTENKAATEPPKAETATEKAGAAEQETIVSKLQNYKDIDPANKEIGILNYIAEAWDIHIDKVGKSEVVLWRDKYYDPGKAYRKYAGHHTDPMWLEGAEKMVKGEPFSSDAEKDYFSGKFGKNISFPLRLYAFYWIYHCDAATEEEKKEAMSALVDYFVQYKHSSTLAMAAYHWMLDSGLLTGEEKKAAAVRALNCVDEKSSTGDFSEEIADMFSLLTLKEALEYADKAHGHSFTVEGSFPLDGAFWDKVDAEGEDTMATLKTIGPLSELPDWVFIRDLKSVPHDQWVDELKKRYENENMPVKGHLISVFLWYMDMKDVPQIIEWLDQRFPDMSESARYSILYSARLHMNCDELLQLLYLLNQHYHGFAPNGIENMVNTRADTFDLKDDARIEGLPFDGVEDVIANGERLDTLPEGKILVLSSPRYMAKGLYVPFRGTIEIPENRFPENLDDVKYVILLHDQDGQVYQYAGITNNMQTVSVSIADCVTSAVVYDFTTGEPVGCLGSFVSRFGEYGSTKDWSTSRSMAYRNKEGLFDWLASFY